MLRNPLFGHATFIPPVDLGPCPIRRLKLHEEVQFLQRTHGIGLGSLHVLSGGEIREHGRHHEVSVDVGLVPLTVQNLANEHSDVHEHAGTGSSSQRRHNVNLQIIIIAKRLEVGVSMTRQLNLVDPVRQGLSDVSVIEEMGHTSEQANLSSAFVQVLQCIEHLGVLERHPTKLVLVLGRHDILPRVLRGHGNHLCRIEFHIEHLATHGIDSLAPALLERALDIGVEDHEFHELRQRSLVRVHMTVDLLEFLFQFNEAHRPCAAQSDEQGLPDFGFALHDLFDFNLKDPVVRFSHEGDAVELGFVF